MIAVRFVALPVLAVALWAQAPPKDVDGWDKIKWGMTIAAVRMVYGIHAQPENKDGWTLLQMNPTKVGDVPMGVQIGARLGSTKITLVRLWSHFGLPDSAPRAGAQDFDALRAALMRVYGPPASEEEKRGENFRLIRTALWKFPSTSILMTLEQSSSLPNLGNIDLEYSPAGP
jgi:hypothetical protein